MSEEEFKKRYEDLLSSSEMQKVYDALKVLNLNFTQFYKYATAAVEEVKQNNSEFTSTDAVKADLTTYILKKRETATSKELKILNDFNDLSLKLPYLDIEKMIAQGEYWIALEQAENNLEILNGFSVRSAPLPTPPLGKELKKQYRRIIKELTEKIKRYNAEKITRRTSKDTDTKIEWIGVDDFLTLLSKELYGEGFIQQETAFFSAIKRQRQIKWSGDPVALSYLIYKLEN
ncbi:MAG TPA: hypothetical protein VF868_10585 [Bacteroidia bacterium]